MNPVQIVDQIRDIESGLDRAPDYCDFLKSHNLNTAEYNKLVDTVEQIFDDFAQDVAKHPEYNEEDRSRYFTILLLDYLNVYGFEVRKEVKDV